MEEKLLPALEYLKQNLLLALKPLRRLLQLLAAAAALLPYVRRLAIVDARRVCKKALLALAYLPLS